MPSGPSLQLFHWVDDGVLDADVDVSGQNDEDDDDDVVVADLAGCFEGPC